MSIPPDKKPDDIFNYVRGNPRDTIAYVLLILGVILLFSGYYNFWGGILLGLVLGFYFGQEIMDLFKNTNHLAEQLGLVRLLVLSGVALGLFVGAPGIFIGAAIALGVKQLAFPDDRLAK